ncbi:hypothetical protein FRX31_012399 [Thalictrum thalictroides]|uniref:Uncharacterized protein n=1 Tax=Thalictrum thalictroides TaxID=46969 RepID=A0A7J6WKV7_THATH|nr:hypothetical protein FRX31_012399 [Thalictrum thalictroides]
MTTGCELIRYQSVRARLVTDVNYEVLVFFNVQAEEKTIVAFTEQMKSFQNDPAEGDNGTGGIYETVRPEVRRAITEIQSDLESVLFHALYRGVTSARKFFILNPSVLPCQWLWVST